MNEKSPLSTSLSYDHADDVVVQRRTQDVEPLLELNKQERLGNLPGYGYGRKNMRKVASIPLSVIEMWKQQGIDIFNKNDMPKIKQMLNSPEWKLLRTSEGSI